MCRKNSLIRIFMLVMILFSFNAFSQELSLATTEPLEIYQDVNDDLSDNPKKSIQSFKKLVKFYKEQGREQELPERYFGMALGLALNGHYPESIRYHRKAIRKHRKYRDDEAIEISINLGLTYHLAGKGRKAKRILGDSI